MPFAQKSCYCREPQTITNCGRSSTSHNRNFCIRETLPLALTLITQLSHNNGQFPIWHKTITLVTKDWRCKHSLLFVDRLFFFRSINFSKVKDAQNLPWWLCFLFNDNFALGRQFFVYFSCLKQQVSEFVGFVDVCMQLFGLKDRNS